MAPLAGNTVCASEALSLHHDPAADARSENDAEHHIGSGAGPIGGFRDRETVRVVHQTHWPRQTSLEIAAERIADEPRRVGVFHESLGRECAGNAHAHRATFRDRAFDRVDEIADRLDRTTIVARYGAILPMCANFCEV